MRIENNTYLMLVSAFIVGSLTALVFYITLDSVFASLFTGFVAGGLSPIILFVTVEPMTRFDWRYGEYWTHDLLLEGVTKTLEEAKRVARMPLEWLLDKLQ